MDNEAKNKTDSRKSQRVLALLVNAQISFSGSGFNIDIHFLKIC